MATKPKITGKHVLFSLVAFFGVILVANVIFISLAVKSFPGVTQEKAYETGLKYNDILAERADQAALGWRAEMTRAERSDDGAVVSIRLQDKLGRPLSLLSVTGELRRPASEDEDALLAFKSAGEGVYTANTSVLSPGAWDLTAIAAGPNDEKFEFAVRVIFE